MDKLISIGLSENEAKIYLALLELGKGTVSEITRKANLNRTTGYDVLDGLVHNGLASVSGKEPKQEYLAEPPDKIEALLKHEISATEEHLKEIKNILPELNRSTMLPAGRR